MKIVVCIPARYDSIRFPGKMLARDTGKYLIQHTYEQALQARLPHEVWIATDDQRILDAAHDFGANAVLTRKDHPSGTDRIAEAVAEESVDIVVNLQGDEPEIDPAHIDQVAGLLVEGAGPQDWPMATLASPLATAAQIRNPNIVKVITDVQGRAIYFSRAAIPYDRDAEGVGLPSHTLRHIGLYAYRKDFLLEITQRPQTPLEKAERLEQLRAIEHGFTIGVGVVDEVCDGIDTSEQYADFVKRRDRTVQGRP